MLAIVPLNQELVAIIWWTLAQARVHWQKCLPFAGGADVFRGRELYDSFLFKASANPLQFRPLFSAGWHSRSSGPTNSTLRSSRHLHSGPQALGLPKTCNLHSAAVRERTKPVRLYGPENTRHLRRKWPCESSLERFHRKTQRMEASSFQDLRQSSTGALALEGSKLARTIQALNQGIADAAVRISLKQAKDADLRTGTRPT